MKHLRTFLNLWVVSFFLIACGQSSDQHGDVTSPSGFDTYTILDNNFDIQVSAEQVVNSDDVKVSVSGADASGIAYVLMTKYINGQATPAEYWFDGFRYGTEEHTDTGTKSVGDSYQYGLAFYINGSWTTDKTLSNTVNVGSYTATPAIAPSNNVPFDAQLSVLALGNDGKYNDVRFQISGLNFGNNTVVYIDRYKDGAYVKRMTFNNVSPNTLFQDHDLEPGNYGYGIWGMSGTARYYLAHYSSANQVKVTKEQIAAPTTPPGSDNPQTVKSFTATSQSELDAFGLRSQTTIHDLTIEGSMVTNLSALKSLKAVTGTLTITGTKVKNFFGLHNLRTIGEDFVISDNQNLISLGSLSSLEGIGTLVIKKNKQLPDLQGLQNLSMSNGKQNIFIVANNALGTLNGLSAVTKVDKLKVSDNYALKDFSGLSNLISLNYLEVERNYALQNFNGLQKLSSLNALNLQKNKFFSSFTGLNNLKAINGWFYVVNNNNLVDFTGLEGLTLIKSSFQVTNNNILKGFKGLENLKNIGNDFSVRGNQNLDNIYLPALESTKDFTLSFNVLLSALSFPRLTLISGNATIADNKSLPICSDNLSGLLQPNAIIDIQLNAGGCGVHITSNLLAWGP